MPGAASAPGGQGQAGGPNQPQQPSYFDVLQASFNTMLQQIAITVKSERRPEERRAVLQNTMAANLNRWQETLDRLEDELNHAKAILRRDYALFVAERDRKLHDAAAKEKASTPAAQPKQEPVEQDDLIMLDAAPVTFAKADRAPPANKTELAAMASGAAATNVKAAGDAKPSTPAAQQTPATPAAQATAQATPASQTNTPAAPAGTSAPGAIAIDDQHPASAADAGLDIAAMLQVLTGGNGGGGNGGAAAASAGGMDLDALPGSGGGPGGFGEPVLLPGLESYASIPESQSADNENKPVSSATEAAATLSVGDADVLGDDNMDDLFGSDNGEGAAEFTNWLNDLS